MSAPAVVGDTAPSSARPKPSNRSEVPALYERLAGFRGLRPGLTAIEATVRRSGGAWVATEVERSGGGGRHGGGDDRREDD